jgi:hypothetical protein
MFVVFYQHALFPVTTIYKFISQWYSMFKYGPCGVTTGWSDASSAVVKCRVDAFYSSSLSASAVG